MWHSTAPWPSITDLSISGCAVNTTAAVRRTNTTARIHRNINLVIISSSEHLQVHNMTLMQWSISKVVRLCERNALRQESYKQYG